MKKYLSKMSRILKMNMQWILVRMEWIMCNGMGHGNGMEYMQWNWILNRSAMERIWQRIVRNSRLFVRNIWLIDAYNVDTGLIAQVYRLLL